MSEKPVHSRLRRLVDWINLTGAKKVHSLIDKVYKRKNLEMAWEKVKANRGSGGVDGETLETFEAQLGQQLDRLQRELKEDTYQPQPVRQHPITDLAALQQHFPELAGPGVAQAGLPGEIGGHAASVCRRCDSHMSKERNPSSAGIRGNRKENGTDRQSRQNSYYEADRRV